MKITKLSGLILSTLVIFLHLGCGDGGTGPTTTTTTTAAPAAVIQVSGNGDIRVHPSAVAGFVFAVEFPMRMQETGGGTAIWNFFRVSYLKNGVEIERAEQGADAIRSAGFRDIGARATVNASVIARSNSDDWDDVQLRLGFIDNVGARAFEHTLDLSSFSGVAIDFTPALLPEGSSFAIVRASEE